MATSTPQGTTVTVDVTPSPSTVSGYPSAHEDVDGGTQIPEIDGSSSAFIALVVVLGVIVFICSILVFILLKFRNPSPYERQLRRARRLQKKHARTEAEGSSFSLPSWLSRKFGGRRAEGWVRAHDEEADEWDARDEVPHLKADQVHARDREAVPTASLAVHTDSPRPDEEPRAESVELQASGHYPSRYDDSSASSPSSTSAERPDERARTPKDRHHREGRFSVQTQASRQRPGSDDFSVRSMRKFSGGTKFKEVLEF